MLDRLDDETAAAVRYYYEKLETQAADQRESENSTRGRRAKVLGGQQMDGFASLIEDLLVAETGVPESSIVHDYHATLPGYYRHEKEWDTAVVHEGELLAVIEYKSQGSSLGNNLNNRAEEAVGSNTDLQKAYEMGLFEPSPPPWVGYLMLMIDSQAARQPRSLREPNFSAADTFQDAGYIDRMEQLCLRMVRQQLVDNAAFLLSNSDRGLDGEYTEPNPELTMERFVRSLIGHVNGYVDQTQLDS